MLTLIIFALILCLMGLTAFTKKPTSPKVETKKTENLDSVLVAKNFYRMYPIMPSPARLRSFMYSASVASVFTAPVRALVVPELSSASLVL